MSVATLPGARRRLRPILQALAERYASCNDNYFNNNNSNNYLYHKELSQLWYFQEILYEPTVLLGSFALWCPIKPTHVASVFDGLKRLFTDGKHLWLSNWSSTAQDLSVGSLTWTFVFVDPLNWFAKDVLKLLNVWVTLGGTSRVDWLGSESSLCSSHDY